ncbi:MAG: hypothetical protein UV76_C0019G0005 [Candidatus Nomurabacteria bacterium GW2011_GWA2_43_15]|uniref:Uncharacterized protein n=2 Tax=Candidatus Nomuraibacteriota TaxID=1752729 RepID=A0A0G1FWW9_9BACT|nr:MAG: hypothetical protein UV76_C0019G0005 [Candidatus Nomurabacteria bacterium GW2011_GWA2_43_15]KKT18925.1 MAG: hypothetical protein UW02_C0019G0008 [Candidatus Nomurabacteria bacterium GW2011_GWB1_43_7]
MFFDLLTDFLKSCSLNLNEFLKYWPPRRGPQMCQKEWVRRAEKFGGVACGEGELVVAELFLGRPITMSLCIRTSKPAGSVPHDRPEEGHEKCKQGRVWLHGHTYKCLDCGRVVVEGEEEIRLIEYVDSSAVVPPVLGRE